jgi:uncharacterized protein
LKTSEREEDLSGRDLNIERNNEENWMPISFEEQTFGGVPLLLASPEKPNYPLPLVLWFHGFSSDKEVHRPELRRMAEAGFLAVGIDAAGHGCRRLSDFDRLLSAPPEEARETMLKLVSQTASEVPAILHSLVSTGMADPQRLSVAGVSMGGYTVYRTIVIEPAIRTAVALLASPKWPHGDSPSNHLDAFERVALLSITAQDDEIVLPFAARELHQKLAARGIDSQRSRYIEIAGAHHMMEPWQWSTAIKETIQWLKLHHV